ncbi:MAG: hypothetical protein HY231_01410 [Acidobacteria bacterium]|nr:hypothetical protein [Acidobacteriota bacterium]
MNARKKVISQLCLLALMALILTPTTFAERREILLPFTIGGLIVDANGLALAYDGRLAFAMGRNEEASARLLCVSLADGKVTDEFDLFPDFGTSVDGQSLGITAQVSKKNGIVVLSAYEVNGTQRVVIVKADESGHFARIRVLTYSALPNAHPNAIFNEEGSRVYVFYNDYTGT